MKTSKFTAKEFLLFIIAIVLLVVYVVLYPELFPDSAIELSLTKSQIIERADETIQKLGYETDAFLYEPRIYQNQEQLRYLQHEYGLSKANDIIRKNRIPVYFWKVKLRTLAESKSLVKISFESENEEAAKSAIEKALSDSIKISLTTDGQLIEFSIKPNAEISSDSITIQEALSIAQHFLREFKRDKFQNYQLTDQESDQNNALYDYRFTWQNKENVFGETEQVKIEIKGSHVIGYNIQVEPPKDEKIASKSSEVKSIINVIAFIVIFIILVFLLIHKLRHDKIDLKSNLFISILVVLAWIFTLINNIRTDTESYWLVVVLPVVITSPFIFMAILAASAVAESESREIWDQKLFTLDSLKKRRILFPGMSFSIFRGLILACISVGLLALLLKLANLFFDFYMDFENDELYNKISFFPFLYILAYGLLNVSYGEFVFRLFFVSYFKKKINSNVIITIICAFIWIISFGGYANLNLSLMPLNAFINLSVGVLFVVFFLKYDFITVFVGAFFYYLLRELYPLVYFDDNFLTWNGFAVWGIFVILVAIAIIGRRKKADFKQVEKYVPDYILRNQERERIRRELEIARRVQLSFLPRTHPKLTNIEVASICIPATEVGGDYYDFIKIDDDRFGVVIGDVSGKGISAAFHMTLTKGFLKSQAKTALSPREIMIHLNELFYENVDRGTFISMIYGIFNLKERTFTFSRAGHNPLLIRKSVADSSEILCPKGLALGLEKGSIFNQIVEEYTFGIHQNDVFMFYTDGFSEAMNEQKQEFGEDRLIDVFERVHTLSPENILNEIKIQVSNFVSDAPQHDDMTMIIIKII